MKMIKVTNRDGVKLFPVDAIAVVVGDGDGTSRIYFKKGSVVFVDINNVSTQYESIVSEDSVESILKQINR
jgi:hypothetical protein